MSNLEQETYELRPKTYKILRKTDTNFTERVLQPKADATEAAEYFV